MSPSERLRAQAQFARAEAMADALAWLVGSIRSLANRVMERVRARPHRPQGSAATHRA
jgi:hypothetical protein